MDDSVSSTPTTRKDFLRALVATGVAAPIVARAEALEAALVETRVGLRLDATSPDSIRQLRARYMLSPDLVYLNHASIGTVPRPVHEAHVGYLEICESHPSLYVWGRVWREVTEETRADAASLLRCRADDLAITHNTTEGFNVLAHGLPLGPGDEILFSSLNHPGGSVPWRGLSERRGFTVRTFDVPLAGVSDLTVDDVVRLHAEAIRPETRVLVVPHVDNMIGMVHPLREVAEAARQHGVDFVVVDGAQSAGMIPVDLSTAGVDAYAMSPHKWLQAPKGLGLFWASERVQRVVPRMWFRSGGTAIERTARKYEDYSTRAWPAVVALGDALRFQASLGEDEKQRRYDALWRRVHARVDAEPRLEWRSPTAPALRSVIMAVHVVGRTAPEFAGPLLADHGAVVRAFSPPLDTLRISPNTATSDGELDRFLDVIASG